MSKHKKEEIIKNKNFCMLPWSHMHMWPNGNAYPCCIWNSDKPIGKFGPDVSMADLWNSPVMKELRMNMLENKPTEGCKRCYLLEQGDENIFTLRKSSIQNFQHHWDLVEMTQPDGSVPEMRMSYLDIRFSNLCNLKCQSCGPELSSAWYDDQVKIDKAHNQPKNIQIDVTGKLWNELEPLLLGVERAYFAGGEPLICDEHYKILDFWLKNGKTDIPINYTTNFTLLTHKNSRVLDYWKKFPNVSVSASLDDSGPQAEYLRKGTIWSNVVRNREMMLEECPEIYFEITPTISAYNVSHFPEFHWEWIQKGLLGPNDIRLNILTVQEYMSIRILPMSQKLKLKAKYEDYLKRIQEYAWSRNQHCWNSEIGYNSVINFMMASDDTRLIRDFLVRASQIDSIREEKLFRVYPELKILLLEL